MVEYEARYRRFVSIRDVSVLNERVFGVFRVKHLLYLFPAIILLWGGLQGRATLLVLGCITGLMGLFSAMFSRGSMSLEAKLVSIFTSLFDLLLQQREKKSRKE